MSTDVEHVAMDEPAQRTLGAEDRTPGIAGPPPLDDRTEISWARMSGRDVVIKAATGPAADALLREAEVLRRLPGGVAVEPVELIQASDHSELVTERFGLLSLGDARLMGADERGRALRRTCQAVQRMHDAGWSHRRIEPSHVLVDPVGDVRLCGLGDAVHDEGTLVEDRLALGAMVLETLEEPLGFATAVLRRRWRRATRQVQRSMSAKSSPAGAAELAQLLDEAGLLGGADADRPAGGARLVRRVPWAVVVTAALGALAVAALLAAVVSSLTDDQPAPGRRLASVNCPTGSHVSDLDGDGCPDPVTISGNDVVSGARHWRVGLPGDVVTLGDWDCDHRATPALLRPSTGEIFVFDTWAEAGAPSSARPLQPVAGAVDLRRPAGICGAPRAIRVDGSIVTASAPPSPAASPSTVPVAPAPRPRGSTNAH